MSKIKSTQIEPNILQRFTIIKKIGSGAYGHVWKVQQKLTNNIFALKKIFDAFQHSTDAQRTFREVQILQQTNHQNIVKLIQTIAAQNNKDLYLIFQYMQSDLHNAIGDNIMKDAHFKFITYQIAKALKYLHSGSIIHRDLKPSNVLVNSDCKIKLCDFGLVRSLVSLSNSNAVLTEGVATRWYRAPQVLLGSKRYSTPADIWSFGCIIYQMIQRKPLFDGSSTLDQLQKIIRFTGIPSEQDIKSLYSQTCNTMIQQIKIINLQNKHQNIMKGIPQNFQDLIRKMIVFNPNKRITIDKILQHSLLKPFRKQNQQISSQKVITTSLDDNRKLSVDQYRKILYKRKCYSEAEYSPRNHSNHLDQFLDESQNKNKYQKKQTAYTEALRKMKSYKNIYQAAIMQESKSKKDANDDSNISWKELIKKPSQALRLSGKIIVKKPEITKNSNQSNQQVKIAKQVKDTSNKIFFRQKGSITITKDLRQFKKQFKNQDKKYDQKTRIEKSQIPNISEIYDGKSSINDIISPKTHLTKKSVSGYQQIFSKAAQIVKKNADNTLSFAPKNKLERSSKNLNLFD